MKEKGSMICGETESSNSLDSTRVCCEHETASQERKPDREGGCAVNLHPPSRSGFCIESAPKTRDPPLVNFAGDPHVVQIVFADLGELAGLIEVKYLAAFNFRCLAGFKAERPGDIVQAHALVPAQPPAAHRVEDAAHVVFAEIHKWPGRNVVHQRPLKDERQIESDDVVADNLVAFDIEIRHQVQKITQGLALFLLFAFGIDSENVFALSLRQAFNFASRNLTNMHGDRKHAPRSRAQGTKLIDTLFFSSDVFQIALLLFEPHVTKPQIFFQLWPDAIAKAGQRQRLNVQRERARQDRLSVLMLAIFLDGDGFVFGDDKL